MRAGQHAWDSRVELIQTLLPLGLEAGGDFATGERGRDGRTGLAATARRAIPRQRRAPLACAANLHQEPTRSPTVVRNASLGPGSKSTVPMNRPFSHMGILLHASTKGTLDRRT